MTARLTGWSRHWRPLPECTLCQRPTRRETFQRNGGHCSDCRPLVVEFGPARDDTADRLDIAEWQALVAARGAEERRKAAERDARRRARRAAR